MSDTNLQQTQQEVDELVNGGLIAISVLIVVQLLEQESLDIPLTVSLYCFAIAIPLLALITFLRKFSPLLKRLIFKALKIEIPPYLKKAPEFQAWLDHPIRIPIKLGFISRLSPLVGIVSFFWHFSGWVAFIFLLSGFIGWLYTSISVGKHIGSEIKKLDKEIRDSVEH